jgi:putative ABC transport system permease protein
MALAASGGAVLAVAGAYATSPLFPLGAIHALEIHPGPEFDLPASVAGVALIAAVSAAVFFAVAWRSERLAPSVASRARQQIAVRRRPGPWARLPISSCLIAAMRAIDGRRALRFAAFGLLVGVAAVTCAVGYTGSVDRLRREPSRYGQAFDLQVELGNPDRNGDDSSEAAIAALRRDPDVADVTVETSGNVVVAGRPTEAYAYEHRQGELDPVITKGRAPERDDEVVIGPGVAGRLGAGVGAQVDLEPPDAGPARRVRVVGVGLAANTQAQAFANAIIVTPSFLSGTGSPGSTSSVALVRFTKGAERKDVISRLDAQLPYGIMSESSPAPPAAVARLAQIGALPLVLAAFILGLAVAGFTNVLLLVARRRRREFVVLRALGLRPRQAAGVVVALALAAAGVAVALGGAAGLVATRLACGAVFGRLDVVPGAWLPTTAVALMLPIGLAIAGVLAALPARMAARQSAAEQLRSE